MSSRQSLIKKTLKKFKTERTEPSDAPRSVRRATAYIHDCLFDADLTVMQVRRALDISDAAFSARFRRHHGHTPARYIRRLRVRAAKRLLRHEDLRVADIAFHVGYEHYRTFARIFKRVTGRSPQEFREKKNGE